MARQAPNSAKSLDQLVDPARGHTPRAALSPAVRRARQVPLRDLTAEQVLTLLHAGEGVRYLIPFALDKLEADPWTAVEFHTGDLLMAVLSTRPHQWPSGRHGLPRLRALALAALKASATLPKPRRDAGLESDVRSWLANHR